MASQDVRRFAHGSRVPGWDESVDLTKDPQEIPDPATTPVPASLRAEIEGHMAKYPDRRSAAIPSLAAAQHLHGWCSPEAMAQVACVMRLTPAYLVSVASFYDMLDTREAATHRVHVCTNISCSLRGGRKLLAQLQEAVGDEPGVQIRGFECLGACDIAPMVAVDGVYVGPVLDDDVAELAQQIREGTAPLPGKQLIDRPSTDPGANSRQWSTGPVDFGRVAAEVERLAAGNDPLPPEPSSFGEPMGTPTVEDDPAAPIEQAPSQPEDEDTP